MANQNKKLAVDKALDYIRASNTKPDVPQFLKLIEQLNNFFNGKDNKLSERDFRNQAGGPVR